MALNNIPMIFSPATSKPFKAIFILLLSGIIAFTIASCGRCDGCWENGGLAFYNFSGTELDSVVIRRYVAGSNFTILKDSASEKITDQADSVPYVLGLTLPYSPDSLQPDILVYLPADSLTYKITNISVSPAHCRRCPEVQLYTYGSYDVNGVKINAPYNPSGVYGGYLSISR